MPSRKIPEALRIVPEDRNDLGGAGGATPPPNADREGADGPEVVPGAPATAPRFETAMAELERIVHDLESGELGLEEALRLYERGVALVRGCGTQLDQAEARLQVLSLDAAGRPVLQPLEEPGA